MSHFTQTDRDTPFLLPPSVQDWLPENDLARYVVAVVEQMDLTQFENAYAGRGSKAYHPAMLLSLLIYGYATGVFSSRKLERATYDSIAFRFITGNQHPDHDTLASFRSRFAKEFSDSFVEVLKIAVENRLTAFGTISLDGTKIHANASRHSALSYAHAEQLELQLKGEVAELLQMAEQAEQGDTSAVPDGMVVPDEIRRREKQVEVIADAIATMKARAKERFDREQAAHEEKMAAREAREKEAGRKFGGVPPKPPTPGPNATDQVNLTDDESRIMPKSGGGFEQSFNAQAAVDVDSMIVVAVNVTQAPNDKQQVEPMIAQLQALPDELNNVKTLIADSGYCSAHNVDLCNAAGITPMLSPHREPHHPGVKERHQEPGELPEDATPMQAMQHQLKTAEGRKVYAKRKQTVEPVFGIIKSVMGFRQFLTRGLDNVRNEWTLVCMAWNVKRMAKLRQESGNCA